MKLSLAGKSLLWMLLLLCLAGCHSQPEPQEQALRFLNALKTQDFGVWYDTAEVDTQKYPTREAFVAAIKRLQDSKKMQEAFAEVEFTAGTPKIDGDTAVVPITTSGRVMGQRQQQTSELKMKRIEGVWKVARENLSYTSQALSGGKE